VALGPLGAFGPLGALGALVALGALGPPGRPARLEMDGKSVTEGEPVAVVTLVVLKAGVTVGMWGADAF
jgi:hypothetical protein